MMSTIPNLPSHTMDKEDHDCESLRTARMKSRIRKPGRIRTRPRTARMNPSLKFVLSPLLLSVLALFSPRTTLAQNGLSIGGVTNTDTCYEALRAARRTLADGREVVTKESYVALVNDLGDDAFTVFQENPNQAGDWGFFPATQFEQLPSVVKDEFYVHACGGAYVTCDEAYLYTDGIGDGGGDAVNLSAQMEVYLFQVCVGVEDAIEEGRPRTMRPTPPPTLTASAGPAPTDSPVAPPAPAVETFDGDERLQLTYRAIVSSAISTEELQNVDSPAREGLMVAMNDWSSATTKEYSGMTAAEKEKLLRRRGRELVVMTDPMVIPTQEFMRIVDVECNDETATITAPLEPSDHCIQVTTNLTIKFMNEPVPSASMALDYIEGEFAKDCSDETFHGMISSDELRQNIRAIYAPSEGPSFMAPAPVPVATQRPTDDLFSLVIKPDNPSGADPGGDPEGGPNIAAIASGVSVGVVVVAAVAFFLVRRRMNAEDKSTQSLSSKESLQYKVTRIDDADLEGGDVGGGRDRGMMFGDDSSHSSSSSGEFSTGDSHSSRSMQSYSGSDRSSRSGDSSYTSRSSYTSESGTKTSSSPEDQINSFSTATSGGNATQESESMASSGPVVGRGLARGPPSVSASESGSESESSSYASSYASSYGSSHASSRGRNENDDPNAHQYEGSGAAVTRANALRGNDAGLDQLAKSSGNATQYSDGKGVDDASKGSDASYLTGSTAGEEGRSARSKSVEPMSDNSSNRKGSTITADDESSAGSSGWDSEDGDSSDDSGSVETYDYNDMSTASPLSSGPSGFSTNSTSRSSDTLSSSEGRRGEYPATINPAVNPVVQGGVTMLPIAEAEADLETSSSVDSLSTGETRGMSQLLPGSEIQEAIEKGDWEAVGATAAILASTGEGSVANTRSRSGSGSGSIMSDILSNAAEDEDEVRAAEIDAMVENGNWDGVVAVAARYADEADEADSNLGGSSISNNLDGARAAQNSHSTNSNNTYSLSGTGSASVGSVSVEMADGSVYSNATRDDSMSHTTYSQDSSMGEVDGGSSGSGTDVSPDTLTDTNQSSGDPSYNTQSSSITSSYVSAGGVTNSMISAVSSVDFNEKRQMSAYRAEVEALVRRVVPDEIDNVDDIMVQFSGREEELIETLHSMQEKSIAQRARAAVQKSATQDLRDSNGSNRRGEESSEDLTRSVASYTEGGETYTDGGGSTVTDMRSSARSEGESYSTYGSNSLRGSGSSSGSGSAGESVRDSITMEYADGEDEYSTSYTRSDGESRTDRSSDSTSVSSYTSGSSSNSDSTDSKLSILSDLGGSLGVISVGKDSRGHDVVKASSGLAASIDAADWRAVGEAAEQLRGGQTSSVESSKMTARSILTGMSGEDTNDELDGMIDAGDWGGIINAASNMTGGSIMNSNSNSSEDRMDSVLDGLD